MYQKFVYQISFITSALLLLIVFSSFNDSTYHYFFSSDSLYLPSIYKDLFINGYSLEGWELNPAPNFFPDMIAYFLLGFLIGDNFILVSFTYSFIQYFILLFLIYKILTLFINKKDSLYFISLGNIFLSLLLVHFLVKDEMWLAFQVTSNSFHLGAFIMTLWITYLSIKYIEKSNIKKLFLIILLTFLASVSDKLFIAQFIGTLLIVSTIYFISIKRIVRNVILLNIACTATAIAGVLLLSKIPRSYINFGTPQSSIFNIQSIKKSFIFQFEHISNIITGNWVGTIIIFTIMLSNILIIYVLIRKKSILKHKHYWAILTLLIYNIHSFFLPTLTGSYSGYDCARYNINVYIISLVIFPFFLKIIWGKKQAFISSLLPFLILIGFVLLNLNSIKNPKQLSAFYPQKTKLIDELKTTYNLKNGISTYWYAKFNTMHSRNNLKIYSVHDNLAKYEHVTNYRWYYETPDKKSPVFNFILMNGDDELEAIKNTFPSYKLIEKGNVTICITPDFTFKKNNPFPVLLN